jgi:hypothetical protein
VSHLPSPLRERRSALLDKLHDYRLAGEFPTNLDFPQERRPCFIDAAGNICAVGYLIEQTAGRALAERITAAHKYDFLADMEMPELTAWVEASGLTARECAMIQPQYESRRNRDFMIQSLLPNTLPSTNLPITREVKVRGLPFAANPLPFSPPLQQFYSKLSLFLFGQFYSTSSTIFRILSPAWSITPISSSWSTSSTVANSWDGLIVFSIPQYGFSTAGTHKLLFESSADRNPYYWLNTYATEATFVVSLATSTRDLTLPSPITISPNPTNDVCMLALPENELHRVRLTNSLGTAVAMLSEATGATVLDVSALAAGVYFVEVESRTTRRRWVQKMVKY